MTRKQREPALSMPIASTHLCKGKEKANWIWEQERHGSDFRNNIKRETLEQS